MKRVLISLMVVIFVASMLLIGVGCKEEATPVEEITAEVEEAAPAEEAADETWVHGVADIITTHPFHRQLIDIQETQIDPNYGCESIYLDANVSIEQQLADIDNLIQMGIDELTIVAVDAVAVAPGAEKSMEAGIPTQCFGSECPAEGIVNVLFDDYNAFSDYAHLLAAYLDYEGNVCYMSGIVGNGSSDARQAGFLDTIAQYPDITVLDWQPSDWLVENGIAIVEDWLNKYDDIDAIVYVDNQMAAPAIEAIKSAKRDIIAVGYTSDDVGLEMMKNGELLFDSLIDPNIFGWYMNYIAYLLYKGVDLETYPETYIIPSIRGMTQETFDLLKEKGVEGLDLDALDWRTPDGTRDYIKELPNIYGKAAADAEYGL